MASFFDGLPLAEPSAATGFAENRIDRQGENRAADAVATALADPAARFYLFAGERVLLKAPGEPLFGSSEAERLGADLASAVLLGRTDTGPRLAATVAEAEAVTSAANTGATAADLRTLAAEGGVSAEHLGAIAQARSLTHWHRRHRFCANCGAETAIANGGARRDCPSCGAEHFPRVDPVAIMLAIDASGGEERCLLGRSPRFQPGVYSCLAGFVEPGETIEDAVRRETAEESGIRIGRVAYHASQPWPFPSSLMIGCHAEALTTAIRRDETELEDARWFDRGAVRAMLAGRHADGLGVPPPMAIAHHLIRAWADDDNRRR
jgi:NAD+ diphosphatase